MALAILGLSASAGADSGSEQAFLSAINSTRSSSGLGSLKMDSGLQSHARKHTGDMIAADEIYHSSSGELQSAAGSGWEKLGENVGRGGSVSSLHQAFLDSPGHKANILGDYNYVGIGTGTSDSGVLYVTVVFMKKGGSSSETTTTTSTTAPSETTETTTAKSPTTTEGPAPEPTTTTTTIPPTTTTTLIVGPDKPVTPGESCYTATRLWWMCHD
ncbi:MAG TPA: CAP domain-containing protein [Acidimicrobiia bacterium]